MIILRPMSRAVRVLTVAVVFASMVRRAESAARAPATPPSGTGGTTGAGRGLVPSRLPEDPVAGKKSEAQWREHLAHEEHERQVRYDKRRLPQHREVVKLLRQARARFDRAKTPAVIAAARARVAITINDVQRRIAVIDRWGDSSNLLKNYEAVLAILTDPYPAAQIVAMTGDAQTLAALRADLDQHMKEIADWLEKVEHEKESY